MFPSIFQGFFSLVDLLTEGPGSGAGGGGSSSSSDSELDSEDSGVGLRGGGDGDLSFPFPFSTEQEVEGLRLSSSGTPDGQWQCFSLPPQVLGLVEHGALFDSGAGVCTLVVCRLTARGHLGNSASSKVACAEENRVLFGERINCQPFPPGALPR